MNFKPSRTFAIEKLNKFIDQDLINYSKLRNFDYGPNKRSNVSCISPYISHGIITELEVINKCLKKYSFVKNEKFIQEILWRIYWKGWLELRPKVWSDYLDSLKNLRKNFKDNQNYLNAIEGKTNIECFNYWVNELKEYNYLHNHVRMWFASIWIFTLNLPWQLGAEFFMQHLYDGDVASNTLGWRWVAGIQTRGKNYLASERNIKKFSNNRFNKIKLDEKSPPKICEKVYSVEGYGFLNPNCLQEKNLLVFENNLCFESTDYKNENFKKIFLISNKNENKEIKLSEKVVKFKASLFEDQKKRLKEKSIQYEILDISEINNLDDAYALYPNVGENLNYLKLKGFSNRKFLYRKLDQFSWQYCNKGFFNFKIYIPKIIKELF